MMKGMIDRSSKLRPTIDGLFIRERAKDNFTIMGEEGRVMKHSIRNNKGRKNNYLIDNPCKIVLLLRISTKK